ncbi:sulfolipid-1 biosynthesis phthioceranic/hydroxyphthioceranic acid synthase [[Mycobacterium] vasticus]|uniref:Sulfolipid-1 biosynthesis phthioceranic/hydroxyphthioceranic acid synthase n=1 Tax=[Mycobacterium] vasticus TaxID=2875777 RepID=A0ABU5Z3P0_9MYCO|nr:sulfolipid-1 biosynthesis phthioceranic/hydroxyphthioceranic acid synthase [Mycolicibacter sp. MYC017]MEB3072027.1 sulfolipid-1 biosynthesis phthioceranic/hydroxyphthioceranic acid synthase [Mycolicibacter sp. MYC017]
MNPIAVIGMACRLPGGIDSPDLLWDAVLRGDDLITEVPADRWNADDYYDPEPGVRGRSVSRWGGFLDDIAGFDSEFFGIGEREATAIDPQHRLLLETSWEAVEHAGRAPKSLAGGRTGVFVGLAHDDYAFITSDAGALADAYGFTGTPLNMASGRVAWALGLRGPAVTVDTSCSSGLFAVHMACRSLQDGESDLALAGACMVMLEPRKFASASGQGMLSPTGRCRTFDAAADGFARSEGCAVVMLKPLAPALADGDRVLAVLRGTATNQDGRTTNILTPSLGAQEEVYRAALAAADVDAATVGMVEAHGTGTPVGDPIEFTSLTSVYGSNGKPCAVGSVKSNLGHTESAAGAVGLIKAILALQHGVVPPMVHFNRLPDDLALLETALIVPQEITSWPSDDSRAPRRAAVSSFGMSGTNVHAILEQAPETAARHGGATGPGMPSPLLFLLSSTSVDGLRRTAHRLNDWVNKHKESIVLSDLAYTLARRRAHRPVRTAVIAADLEQLVEELHQLTDEDAPYQGAVGQDDRGPVWVFSGQGSQWAAMGADLLTNEPVFAVTVAAMEPLVAAESGFSVTEAMTAPQMKTSMDRVQPTLFAMQVALAATMKSYGVTPGAVVGHSMGEVAAAVVAGALSLEDGVRVICRRSRLLSRIAGSGAMASVELPARQVRTELVARGFTDVVVSVVASPQSTVIGGATQSVYDLVAAWEQRGVMAREVAVDVASHSPQVDPILDELSEVLAEISPMTPQVPFYSTTLFDQCDRPTCDADYWVDNLRHTVRFGAAAQAAMEDGYRVFAELAPHPLLTHAVQQTAAGLDMPVAAVAAMRREQPLPHGLRALLADLHSAGAAVDFSVLYPRGRLVDAPLPAWTHRRLLLTPDRLAHQANTVSVHSLLGTHVPLPEEPERHAWHADVGTAALPWLDDHRVHNVAALPGAAYCEMALAAARTVLGEGSEVCDIRFEQMLLLEDKTPVFALASVASPGVVDFVVETFQEGERVRRAVAVLHAQDRQDQPPPYDIAALRNAYSFELDWADLRQWFDDHGLHYGPVFTAVTAAHAADSTASAILADVALPGSIRSQQSGYGIHPALLDSCIQSVYAHPAVQGSRDLLLPLGVRRLRSYAPARNARYCHVTVTNADAAVVEADLDVLDEHGTVLLAVRGLQLGTGVTERASRDRSLNERLLTIDWQQRELPEVERAHAGTWLLISTSRAADVVAVNLSDALKLQGAQCTPLNWPQQDDQVANVERLRDQLGSDGFTGVVVLTGPHNGYRDKEGAVRGGECVRRMVHIARDLTEIAGELPRLYVVTVRAQTVLADDVVNLEQGGLRGLLRVIGAEHPQLRTTQIDIDERTDVWWLARQLLADSDDDETAWRNSQWYTARLCPAPLRPEDRRTTIVDQEHDGLRLQIRTPGDPQTMEVVALARTPPGPGQIEVAVTASSVNFADVLVTFGRYPGFEGQLPQLGFDFVGAVAAIGPDVTDHRVGDHVGGMSPNGCWGTFVTCDARLAATLPPGITDAQAASVTTVYATAWYGLHDLARIRAGDKVLIHSATGGVGQAAIAIARAAGAEIFATAGSAPRRSFLHYMGIEHVYDSRGIEFAEQIRRDTDGYGVDIVLNSLTGAAQHVGIQLLAMGGRFVEIGKRDIYGDSKLGLFPFRRNLSFYAVDLALLSASHPAQVRALLNTVYALTTEGALPMPQSIRYPLSEAATAIRAMSAAEHTGKLVLDIPHTGHSSAALPPEQVHPFRDDGAYIISGGLGGLGLLLAEKMAVAGCGRLVLTSRSEPDQQALQTIERLRASGADIVVQCGDIAQPGLAARLVSVATATGLPLRGVLHVAAVVEDATLSNITDELIERNWAPKVYGAWHLHQATAAQPLDWFCSFSSAAALLGSPGQGAYAAANSWLDAFTHWRRAQGLPATAIAWGPWAKVGRAAALADSGHAMISPDEGAYAFEVLLRHDRGYTGYAPTVGSPWLTALTQRSRFAELFQAAEQNPSGTSKFRRELNELPLDQWSPRLRRLVSEQVGLILRRNVDPDRPLFEYGLDSLGNLELRTRIENETAIRINSADVSTVRGVAEHLCATLTAQEGKCSP